jgi:hypothetical protein
MELVTCCNLALSYQEIYTCQGKEYFMPVILFYGEFSPFCEKYFGKTIFCLKKKIVEEKTNLLQKNDLNFYQFLPQLPTMWKVA